MSKTYWGLTEIEVNEMYKAHEEFKDRNGIYLFIEVKPTKTYEEYEEIVKLKYPDFDYKKLKSIEDLYLTFIEQKEILEYDEFLKKNSN